jgi:hypothetical protein
MSAFQHEHIEQNLRVSLAANAKSLAQIRAGVDPNERLPDSDSDCSDAEE